MKNVMQFLHEVRFELAKIEWPKFDEWVGATIISLLLVICFSLFFGVVDRIIAWIAHYIFTYSL